MVAPRVGAFGLAARDPYADALVTRAEPAPKRPPNWKPAGSGPCGNAHVQVAHGSRARPSAEQQGLRAEAHQRQVHNACVPVYLTGTQIANRPPSLAFEEEKMAWTTGPARLGQRLDRKRVVNRHRVALERTKRSLGIELPKNVDFVHCAINPLVRRERYREIFEV